MKLRNKIISLVSAIAMTITMLSSVSFAAAGDELGLNITSTSVKAGEQAVVTVALNNNPSLYALSFYVEFADGFVVPAVANSADCVLLTGNSTVNTSVRTGGNTYLFDWSDDMFMNPVDTTGKLFTLNVNVPEGTAAGKYPITVSTEYICDSEDNEDLTVAVANADAYIEVVGDEPTTVAKYFAASFTPGVKSAANNAIKFLFQDGEKTGSTAVKYGATIENLESVVTAVEVKDVPADSALELVGTEWTTVE